MTRRDTLLKWAAYGVALAVITILNYYILGRLPITMPLLLPAAAVAAGILENSKFGAGFGLACGLIMAAIGHHSLICIPVLAAAGWLCGMASQHVLRRDLVGYLLCAVILLVLWELAQIVSVRVATGAPLPLLAGVALPELLWSLVFSFPVYWAARFCCLHYGRIYHE